MDALKADRAKLALKLKSKEEPFSQLLEKIMAFTKRVDRSNEVSFKDISKCLTTKRKMIEDAVTIESLKSELHKVGSCIREIKRQAVEDYLKSSNFDAEKIQIFKDGSRFYQDKCEEAGLDLSIVAAHIKRGYGLPNSSQVLDLPPSKSAESEVG